MGKLKNAYMENHYDDMRFGQTIEQRSTDALTLLLGEPELDPATRGRVERELQRRKGNDVGYPTVTATSPTNVEDVPTIDLVMYDLWRVADYIDKHQDEIEPYRDEIISLSSQILHDARSVEAK